MDAANTLKEEAGQILEGCPILVRLELIGFKLYRICAQVDPMDDRANLAYAALPERLYVLQDGKITYEVK